MWYFNQSIGAYMGDRIADDPEIEDRPSPQHTWNGGQWLIAPWYDWQGLKDAMRNTVFFGLAFGTTNANAFTLMLATLDSASPNESKLQDFVYAVSVVRAGMPVDYNKQQLEELRGLLQEYGFPVFL